MTPLHEVLCAHTQAMYIRINELFCTSLHKLGLYLLIVIHWLIWRLWNR